MIMQARTLLCLAGIVAIFLQIAMESAGAQTVEEFYRGRTIEIYVGVSVGGGYDSHMRVVARHIGKHIPGNPTVVSLNMVGAGSL